MILTLIGRIGLLYTERLEQYFEANDVVSAVKQRAILLSICGASAYQLIRDLVAPAIPISKSFAELVKLVKATSTLFHCTES